MLSSSEIDNLRNLFGQYPKIKAVYLFGSAAYEKRTNSINSDIDLGIVASDNSIEKQKTDLYADMIRHGFDNTDLVFFNSADLVLQFEIIHQNKLIYSTRDHNHGKLFSITIRKYLDFKPYLKHQRKIQKSRIING